MNGEYNKIKNLIEACGYDTNLKDYIEDMIVKVINYPKKKKEPYLDICEINSNYIIRIRYQMDIPFNKNHYSISLLIFILKTIPYDSPKLFLEVHKGVGICKSQKNINSNTGQITTNSLRN